MARQLYTNFPYYTAVIRANNIPKNGRELRYMRDFIEDHEDDVGPLVSIKQPNYSRAVNDRMQIPEKTTVMFIRLFDRSRSEALLYLLNNLYMEQNDVGARVKVSAKPCEWSRERYDEGLQRTDADICYVNALLCRSVNHRYELDKQAFRERVRVFERAYEAVRYTDDPIEVNERAVVDPDREAVAIVEKEAVEEADEEDVDDIVVEPKPKEAELISRGVQTDGLEMCERATNTY
jgi:hypothetical protein